jgi:hypothetical protein
VRLSLSWNKIIRTKSSGDYLPAEGTPATAFQERRELIAVPVRIKAPHSAGDERLKPVNTILERWRKTILLVTGLVSIGTYGPACKDICNIVGEVIYINHELNAPLHRPVWFLARRRAMARLQSLKAQTPVHTSHPVLKQKAPTSKSRPAKS